MTAKIRQKPKHSFKATALPPAPTATTNHPTACLGPLLANSPLHLQPANLDGGLSPAAAPHIVPRNTAS